MKNKVSSISLIAILGALLILIVGSVPMINFEWLFKLGNVWYVNWVGEIVGFVKKSQSGGVTMADLYKAMAVFQIIVLLLQMLISGILLKLAQENKKFKMSAFVLIVLSTLQIFDPVVSLSALFEIVSFLPIVATVTYLIARRIEFNCVPHDRPVKEKKVRQEKLQEEIDPRKIY